MLSLIRKVFEWRRGEKLFAENLLERSHEGKLEYKSLRTFGEFHEQRLGKKFSKSCLSIVSRECDLCTWTRDSIFCNLIHRRWWVRKTSVYLRTGEASFRWTDYVRKRNGSKGARKRDGLLNAKDIYEFNKRSGEREMQRLRISCSRTRRALVNLLAFLKSTKNCIEKQLTKTPTCGW